MIKTVKETSERRIQVCDWCKKDQPYGGFTCLSCGKTICSECLHENNNFKFFEVNYGLRLEPRIGAGDCRNAAAFCSTCIGKGRDKLIIAMFKDECNDAAMLEQFREYRSRQIRGQINAEIERREKRFGIR